MSTRSLTVFAAEESEIAVLYRHWDGYPEGHGRDLAEFLIGGTITNGIGGSDGRRAFNGIEDLIVRTIVHLKITHASDLKEGSSPADVAGNLYLYRANTRNMGEDYIYTVSENKKGIQITMTTGGEAPEELFRGTPEEFLAAYPIR